MRSKNILTGVAALLLCLTQAQPQERPVSFYLTSPLNLQSGFDSGVPDGNRKVNSPSTILTLPTFSMMRTTPRTDFSIFYQPEFQMFSSEQRLDTWNHNAGLRWETDFSPRWSFTANDTFSANHDYGERFQSSFLLPLGPYKENGLYTSLNFDLTPETKIKFRYENAFVDFRSQDLSTPLFFSRMGNTFGATVERQMTPKGKLSVSYNYLLSTTFDKYDATGNLILPFDPTHYVGATYSYDATKSVLLEFTGGYVHNPQNSYVVGGVIEKHLPKMIVAGGFNRYLTFLGSPTAASIGTPVDLTLARELPPNSITNTVSFRMSGYFTEHWGIETLIMASRTNGDHLQALRSAMGGLRVNYRISDHVVAFTSFDLYRQNANAILPVAISRGRYYGGIEYTFSPTPDEINRRKELSRNRTNSAQTPQIPALKEN